MDRELELRGGVACRRTRGQVRANVQRLFAHLNRKRGVHAGHTQALSGQPQAVGRFRLDPFITVPEQGVSKSFQK